MNRLSLRLYAAFLGVLLAVVVVSGAINFVIGRPVVQWIRGNGRLAAHIGRHLPPTLDPFALHHALELQHDDFGIDLAILGPDGGLLAAAGNPIPVPPLPAVERAAQIGGFLGHGLVAARARGGGFVVLRPVPLERSHAPVRLILWLAAVLAVSFALVYPLSRTITRPLERLTAAVESYGRGNLEQRSGLAGSNDEVGRLARSFDEMADRIQIARRTERELLANVSHELRTPLARLKVAVELVDARDEATLRRLAAVGEEVDELDRLIGDVLTATRLDLSSLPLRRTRVALAELVSKARARILALDPSMQILVRAEPGLMVDADEALLGRALHNLLDNARKYAGSGAIEVDARRDGARALLSVRDHGPGIPEAELPRVFDPFWRGDAARGAQPGFGLGLALARRVAEAHGGGVRAWNAEGGGARIEVWLPAPEAAG